MHTSDRQPQLARFWEKCREMLGGQAWQRATPPSSSDPGHRMKKTPKFPMREAEDNWGECELQCGFSREDTGQVRGGSVGGGHGRNHSRQKVCESCIRALGMRVSVMTERGYLWQQDPQSCDRVSQTRPVLYETWTSKKAEAIRRIGPLLTCHNALLEERTVYSRRISSLWVPSQSPGVRSWGRLCALYRIAEKGDRTNLNRFHFKSIRLSHIGKKNGAFRIYLELQ